MRFQRTAQIVTVILLEIFLLFKEIVLVILKLLLINLIQSSLEFFYLPLIVKTNLEEYQES